MKIPRARLSRRIVLWVFASVIIIETIIFIPSYNNRKHELLDQLKMISWARVSTILQGVSSDTPIQTLVERIERLENFENILGGAIYGPDGKKISGFGDLPILKASEVSADCEFQYLLDKNYRYDIGCPLTHSGENYTLILRNNAESVKKELNAFMLRIGGLVVIISIFVTVGAWIAVEPIVVRPILKLRGDLIRAGDAVQQDQKTPEFESPTVHRQDELGEVIAAFMKMFNQITDAIRERKHAEKLLQESLTKVQSYSNALDNELEQGRQMQRNFLPSQLPQPAGWEIAAFFKPARQVAGDFYDVFELPGKQVGLVIADVCDKGVGAALFMALFRSLIRIYSGHICSTDLPESGSEFGFIMFQKCMDPTTAPSNHQSTLEAVQLTNNYIFQNHSDLDMFATLFFGVLDPASGLLTYINGGHEPPCIIDSEGIKNRLKPNGPALGLSYNADFKVHHVELKPGDILIGYTDGVTDARSYDDELFSRERLEGLMDVGTNSVQELLDRIKENLFFHMNNSGQDDDITMLAIQRLGQDVS